MTNYQTACVYFFKNKEKELLYIGKTYNLKNRLYQHLNDVNDWKSSIYYIDYMIVENETDRDLIETYCINLYDPIYNKDKIFGVKPTIELKLPKIYNLTKEQFIADNRINRIKGTGTFREILEEYCKLIDKQENINRQENLIKLEPEIKDIVIKLGTSRIRSLSYSKSAINKELYQSSTEVTEAIKENLINLFESNKFYSSKDIKQVLQKLYKQLNLTKKAKAVDVSNYLNAKATVRRFEGKSIKGFVIQYQKLVKKVALTKFVELQ